MRRKRNPWISFSYQVSADPKIIASKIYKTIIITKLFLGREQQLELVVTVELFEQDIKTPPLFF